MNVPRRHHYVSQFQLANFTLQGGKDDRLWVFDQAKCEHWKSTPKKAAHQHDFYRIDAGSGVAGMAVEEGFGRFETDVAAVVRDIVARRALPSGSRDYDLFINFIALQINRVPAVRDKIREFAQEVSEKEEFARQCLRKSGEAVLEKPADNLDQTWLVESIILGVPTLVPHLVQRKWSLWFVDDGAPDLICSDNPVALTWTVGGTGPWAPGFAHRHTQLSWPLTRRILVVGSFEGQLNGAPLDERSVAAANSCTGRDANQLYSATEDFVWLMKDGQVGRRADLEATLKAAAGA